MSTLPRTFDCEAIYKRLDSMVQNTHYDQLVVVESLSKNGMVSINAQKGIFRGSLFCSSELLNDTDIADKRLASIFDFVLCIGQGGAREKLKHLSELTDLGFATMSRTPGELAIARRLAADERVMCQLCRIARCDEAEVKRQVERIRQSIHSLRAYYLANGEWPR